MMAAARLILASASPRRLELLRQAGISPDKVVPADINESTHPREVPLAYARRTAKEKATAVSSQYPGNFILAADTVVALGRRILPKAETEAEARECLALLSGRRHRVISGICVIAPDGKKKMQEVTSVVRFQRLTAEDIDGYIASGEWQGKAGGYAIQGKAAILISFMSGSYSNIVGLPLHETLRMLKGLGYERA